MQTHLAYEDGDFDYDYIHVVWYCCYFLC